MLAQGAELAAEVATEVATEAAVEQVAEDVADTAAAVPAEKAPVWEAVFAFGAVRLVCKEHNC